MEATPDRFEVALQTWVAEESIVYDVRRLTEQLDLDPALAEDVEESFRSGDLGAKREALTAFLRVLKVAIE